MKRVARLIARFLVLGALLAACQTVAPRHPAAVPAVLDSLFVTCLPGDGASTLQIFQEGKILGAVTAEWLAKPSGDWDVELASAIGQTVLSVSRRGGQVSVSGPLAAKAPMLAIDDEGFLEVGGHFVPIKADEVPCLLAHGYPRGWLGHVDDVEINDQHVVVEIAAPRRGMTITAPPFNKKTAASSGAKVCAEISWRTMLVVPHDVMWCQEQGGRREASLRGLNGYSMKWVKIDER